MKVALITATFGNTDVPKSIPQQSVPYNIFRFSEKNTPFTFPNLNNRLKAKFFKCQSHHLPGLEDYDYHLWVDGSVQIKSNDYVKDTVERLKYADVVIGKHPERSCIYKEMDFVMKSIADGNPYLVKRYGNQQLDAEKQFYLSNEYPPNNGLYACGIWGRCNTAKVNLAFDYWWMLCLAFSYFDQPAFPFSMWKHKIDIADFGYGNIFDNKYFKLIPHIEQNMAPPVVRTNRH